MGVEFNSVRVLAREFGQVPFDLRRELRPRLRQAGDLIRSEAQANAAWSSRIPGAIRMTVSFASKTGGIRIYVDSKKAPHARPYEGAGRGGTSASSFRHPVFGNRNNWVAQPTRPFLFPAVRKAGPKVRSLVEDAVRASFPKGKP